MGLNGRQVLTCGTITGWIAGAKISSWNYGCYERFDEASDKECVIIWRSWTTSEIEEPDTLYE